MVLSKAQLDELQKANIKGADIGTLPNLLDIGIHGDTAVERLASFLSRVENPYCFRVDKTPVRISFNENGNSLEELLKTYFLGLKC